MASSLYRWLGTRLGRGYEEAKGRQICRDCIDALGRIPLTDAESIVRSHKRAHTPLLSAAGVANTTVAVSWLGDKRLRLVFGELVVVLSIFPNMGIQASASALRHRINILIPAQYTAPPSRELGWPGSRGS
jgi:hypothetical protein